MAKRVCFPNEPTGTIGTNQRFMVGVGLDPNSSGTSVTVNVSTLSIQSSVGAPTPVALSKFPDVESLRIAENTFVVFKIKEFVRQVLTIDED
jgi:hypothetical protein